ncbi:hypothetical protein JOF53_005580 [Crossiella equi]|uniref:Gram-positive cocci surface proteins LPxTG domain-containing protein n=1 Tax=Crossiella equi TaxID=130796 RepID=A0ABS5AJF4_9PSEU|nr:hypothetical protein [Crossiella equi]MBP2476708.1 hypothetical protein [Crossiella equi]
MRRSTALPGMLVLALLALAGQAAAQPPLASGDPRATAFDGNATTCAGFGGTLVTGQLTVSVTSTHVTITAVPPQITLTAVVLKGGDAYNLYLPAGLGALPWTGLHSPLVGQNGNIPQISHWFACGTTKTTTTKTTTTTTTRTTTATTTTTTRATSTTRTSTTTGGTTTSPGSTEPTTTPSSTSGESTTPVVSTTPVRTTAPVPVAEEDLARTGFDGGWLLALGVLLLLGGGLTLAVLRSHRR